MSRGHLISCIKNLGTFTIQINYCSNKREKTFENLSAPIIRFKFKFDRIKYSPMVLRKSSSQTAINFPPKLHESLKPPAHALSARALSSFPNGAQSRTKSHLSGLIRNKPAPAFPRHRCSTIPHLRKINPALSRQSLRQSSRKLFRRARACTRERERETGQTMQIYTIYLGHK